MSNRQMGKNGSKNHGKKIRVVLDLDNTILSSLTLAELKKIKNIDKRKLKSKVMDGYYKIFLRPHLDEFLTYLFKNFDVSVFTAASRDYGSFIVEHIILNNQPERKLDMFLYDDNCAESQKYYNKNSPKDLRYLYNFDGYFPCNTIIIDDLLDVYKANPKQTIRAPFFDAKKQSSENDRFLLDVIEKLENIKDNYNGEKGCVYHKH